MGATVEPTAPVAPDPAQSGGAAKTSASVIRMKVANPAQATPTRGKEVRALLVTGTAPGLSRGGGIVGLAPEAGVTEFKNPVAPAREAGVLVEAEARKSTMTVIPRTKKSEGTKGAVAGWPLQDAIGHPAGETSEGISLGMRSRARSCRA